MELLERSGGHHSSETLHNVVVEHLAHFIGDVSLWIHFSDVLDRELLIRHVLLVLQRLLVVLRELQHRLQMLLVRFATLCVVLHTHCVHPRQFVEIQQHLLLQIVCSVRNGNRVVVTIETMDQCLK